MARADLYANDTRVTTLSLGVYCVTCLANRFDSCVKGMFLHTFHCPGARQGRYGGIMFLNGFIFFHQPTIVLYCVVFLMAVKLKSQGGL